MNKMCGHYVFNHKIGTLIQSCGRMVGDTSPTVIWSRVLKVRRFFTCSVSHRKGSSPTPSSPFTKITFVSGLSSAACTNALLQINSCNFAILNSQSPPAGLSAAPVAPSSL